MTSRTTTSANDDRAFAEELAELRAAAACVPDDVLVCLVGNMVTEEALPTYQSMFNRTDGVGDDTGASAVPWARWIRGWTAEENRTLSKICGVVAADERRHEAAYTRASAELFDVDPDGMVRALAYVMLGKVTMPGLLMSDGLGGGGDSLFARFSAVAQRAGVYTASDYGDMVEHFVRRWRVADLGASLSDEGRCAQEYVCGLAPKIRRMEVWTSSAHGPDEAPGAQGKRWSRSPRSSISRDWRGKKDIVLSRTHVSDPLNRRKRTEWGQNSTRV